MLASLGVLYTSSGATILDSQGDDRPKMKDFLRQQAYSLAKEITLERHTEASASVCRRLLAYLSEIKYDSIGLYMPMQDEVDIRELFSTLAEYGKEVYLPRVIDQEHMAFFRYYPGDALQAHATFPILEPSRDASKLTAPLDVLIIPAVHYHELYRLGRGRGYYDKYIRLQRPKHLIGVTLGILGHSSFTPDPWDEPVDVVFSANSI